MGLGHRVRFALVSIRIDTNARLAGLASYHRIPKTQNAIEVEFSSLLNNDENAALVAFWVFGTRSPWASTDRFVFASISAIDANTTVCARPRRARAEGPVRLQGGIFIVFDNDENTS